MSEDRLFEPLQLGDAKLQHRIVMAPLTRFRADRDHNPSEYAKTYYEQRASVSGTLLITEATFISPQAGGYKGVPGIWSEAQISGWKDIVDAVHQNGSAIFLQLWALGRAAGPAVLEEEGGYRVRSASAIASPVAQNSTGERTVAPDALTEEEIQSFVQDYADAAKNAIAAGFDGVEIHGANGYLVDQFWQDVTNQRTDRYGGSVQNRANFGLEVTKAIIAALDGDSKKVAMRLSPYSTFQGMGMKDPVPQFTYVVEELRKLNLAYLHLTESRISGGAVDAVYKSAEEGTPELNPFIDAWGKDSLIIIAGGYTPDKAKKVVNELYPDSQVAIAFGRYFISTPDLPFRLKHGIDLNEYNRPTFYVPGSRGYIDYPFSDEFITRQGNQR